MTEGFGNTRKQAERNASINGLRWLKENKLLEENAASCSGVGVHHNPNDVVVPVAFNNNTATQQQHVEDDDCEADVEMTVENDEGAYSDNDAGEEIKF